MAKVGIDASELVKDHGFHEGRLAREAGVQSFFAHSEFFRKVVHGDTAKSMSKKVASRFTDNPTTDGMPGERWGCWHRAAWHRSSRSHRLEKLK
jgi:hypothetical protein